MENWCYDKKTLYGFAKHYETGAPLPEELFQKVKAAKNFHAGMQMMRQLFFGMLDVKLHSTFDPFSGGGAAAGSSTVAVEGPFALQQEVLGGNYIYQISNIIYQI